MIKSFRSSINKLCKLLKLMLPWFVITFLFYRSLWGPWMPFKSVVFIPWTREEHPRTVTSPSQKNFASWNPSEHRIQILYVISRWDTMYRVAAKGLCLMC